MGLILSSLASWVFLFLYHINRTLSNERGGGSDPQPASTTIIQQPPAPSAGESAADLYQARLQYDPQMAAQEFALQQQYMPQQAELYQSLYNQYYPQLARQQQALQRELYPQQSQILESGATQALERIQNPMYMTAQEQAAQTATREKSVSDLQKAMRERANLGGGLYGGRTAAAEAQSVSDLLNQYQIQDYQNRMIAGQNAQAALTPYMQILYPQIGTQQPNIQPYQFTSTTPSADTLYNAMYGATRPQVIYDQGTAGSQSPMWGLAGSAIGALGSFGGGWASKSSIRYKKNIKRWA